MSNRYLTTTEHLAIQVGAHALSLVVVDALRVLGLRDITLKSVTDRAVELTCMAFAENGAATPPDVWVLAFVARASRFGAIILQELLGPDEYARVAGGVPPTDDDPPLH